ncbi:ABC-F family ATP-binding cassette domain-containing protein [Cytophaga hutchinsonii]|uniref:ABC transporter, ATP-binding protein n=1 Tax=Cytophaga hutchinsonii (strain ATCC 33406 / DSM 1761 / CIP 103989 / NBRC 15051 / NCIMB 9469 / D465) TaxID=269798 RepID=A0A6N4ST61_CYTH3|nr:ABC-F family ATP-binding cassette domain-containing protein [Cytophaga hutchinsonii]ABG59479.1 ABC transporter, ATP-binding protein [Cytophaga hutchinsonii ATCC 33406]SFX96799.1 ATP-binding cassette, subfamily F, member 3 [Cytophaga hutchinsonii ATCC 33406]
MLTLNNISYFIGGRALYRNITMQIKPKDKIGLIGANGTGKSTLLKVITGEYSADEGNIQKSKDCTIGFLNQDLLSFQSDESILAVAMEAFEEATKIQIQMDQLIHKMETDYTDDMIEKLSALQERFQALEGYTIQSKAEKILEGLGFSTNDLNKPLKNFSGGWRMRVMLAKMLLAKPALLMLDEPTNHLDLPSIQWLENYLRDYEGAVIVVSHDREFIDNCVKTIVEVAQQTLNIYAGNYSFYLEEKELRSEIQKASFENQQAKIKQTERFIERFKAKASKSTQVQSRVKALDRMDMIEDVVEDNQTVNFRFTFKTQPGRVINELKNISKSYGDLHILKNTDAKIERGDKIALIGANGKGKSTVLRILTGGESAEGEVALGHNVISSFYAQHQLESLNINNEILEELKQHGSNRTETELRNVLGCFLFSSDDAFKKIKVLSGGEKSRVALAKTLISDANYLLLDEPTNHLDMVSVNILIQALQQYEGTLIVISHDRHFVSKVANKIWYIEDQEIKVYPGTYDEYKYWIENIKTTGATAAPKEKKEPVAEKKKAPAPAADPEIKKIQQQISRLEEQITALEKKKTAAEEHLAKPEVYGNPDQLAKASMEFDKVDKELLQLQTEWEMCVEKLEQ